MDSDESQESKIEQLWSLIKKPWTLRAIENSKLTEIAICTLYVPARMIVYLTSEICQLDFWTVWKELKPDVYADVEFTLYEAKKMEEQYKVWSKPIPPVKTSEFLCQGIDWGTSVPDEWKELPDYYISDDDRMFWWDGTSEVCISKITDEWLIGLGKSHKEIMDCISQNEYDKCDILKKMMEVLSDANLKFKRIFAFKNMFYEFVQNADDKNYIAAIELFKKLCEENKETVEIMKNVKGWEFVARKVKFNPGRLQIKRFLAVMANQKLRREYFGF